MAFLMPTFVFSASANVPDVVISIKDAALTIGYFIVIIGWIIAGIIWLTSAGNPERTGLAKKATIAAVIGTVVVILANVAYEALVDLLGMEVVDV